MSFIVNRYDIKYDLDVLSDGIGHWEKMKSKIVTYGLNNGQVSKLSPREGYMYEETFNVNRHLSYYRTCKTFKRVVTFVENCNYIYMQYYFKDGDEGSFILDETSHGNAKVNKTPYYRTKESVKKTV